MFHVRSAVLLLLFASILYGTSYQQFRHFDFRDPRGGDDSISYLKMSYDRNDADYRHRSRVVIPYLASKARPVLALITKDPEELSKLSFYCVNFVIVLAAAFILYFLFLEFHFNTLLSLLGCSFFLSSRMVVLHTGVPLIDSFYYLAIVVIVYLTVKQKTILLSFLNPILILSKETIYPFMFLPFFESKTKRIPLLLSLMVSFGVAYGVRHFADSLANETESNSYTLLVRNHIGIAFRFLPHVFSWKGLHDFQNGFSFFILFAVLGFIIERRQKKHLIPNYLLALVVFSFLLSIVGKSFGRFFFSSFIFIYAYSLVFLEHWIEKFDPTLLKSHPSKSSESL